ncbi:MAG: phosphotransferase [Mycobacteriaceae bacterium]
MLSIDSALESATHLLASRFGGTPELTHPEDLGGSGESLVVRVRVTPNPFLQERSVVIKQLPPLEGGEDEATAALVREVVAYQYTNTLAEENRPGPQLLAHDIEGRLMVLSDAGDGRNYADILTVDGEFERAAALRKLGRALGRMHVATADGQEAFDTLNRRLYSRHNLPAAQTGERDVDVAVLVDQGLELLRRSGVAVHPTVEEFAEEAGQRQHRSRLQAFTPFDLTPDNIMLADSVEFLDYEWAGFRDIVSDVACVIAGFPHDTTTPLMEDAELREFVEAWSSEVIAVWPAVREEGRLEKALMASLVGWSLMSLSLLYHGTLAVIEGAGSAAEGARRLDRMPREHLADLATTVESVRRFATQHHESDERFTDVGDFAVDLLSTLSRLGAHPQTR